MKTLAFRKLDDTCGIFCCFWALVSLNMSELDIGTKIHAFWRWPPQDADINYMVSNTQGPCTIESDRMDK